MLRKRQFPQPSVPATEAAPPRERDSGRRLYLGPHPDECVDLKVDPYKLCLAHIEQTLSRTAILRPPSRRVIVID